MSGYILGRDAARDLEHLWDYIAEDSVDTADRVTASLFEAFENLSLFPDMGHPREDLTNLAVRFWPVGNYFVIYRAERGAVTHGKRDIPAFLKQRSQS